MRILMPMSFASHNGTNLAKRAFTMAPSASSNTHPIQNLPSKSIPNVGAAKNCKSIYDVIP
jgi:hypothetical protein